MSDFHKTSSFLISKIIEVGYGYLHECRELCLYRYFHAQFIRYIRDEGQNKYYETCNLYLCDDTVYIELQITSRDDPVSCIEKALAN
jgi:hypothetical protein